MALQRITTQTGGLDSGGRTRRGGVRPSVRPVPVTADNTRLRHQSPGIYSPVRLPGFLDPSLLSVTVPINSAPLRKSDVPRCLMRLICNYSCFIHSNGDDGRHFLLPNPLNNFFFFCIINTFPFF